MKPLRIITGTAMVLASLFSLVEISFAQQMTQHTTPAGHKFWHFPMKDAKRTAVAVNWPSEITSGGFGHEATARLGIDLMLNGGAGGRSPDELIADFQDLDSGSRLWAQPREIRGFIVAPDQHMDTASEIANSVLLKPHLDEKWFKRQKRKLVDRAKGAGSNSWNSAWNLARNIMLDDHPYRNFWSLFPAAGVETISLSDVRQWHKTSFATNGITVTVAGNPNVEAVAKAIDTAMARLPAGAPKKPLPFEGLDVKGKTVVLHRPDSPKSIILVIGELPGTSKGQDLEINLATGVLGFGKQSRLFKAIRSELRAAYRFGSRLYDFTRDYRVFTLGGEVDPDKLQAAFAATKNTYEEFLDSGIGLIEFPLARRYYRQRIEKEMKKPESVAYMMMENRLNQLPSENFDQLKSRINSLERGRINSYIKENYPRFETMLKIIISADRNAIEGACVLESIDEWKRCF